MPAVKRNSTRKMPAVAKLKPVVQKEKPVAGKATKPATKTPVVVESSEAASVRALVPGTPESKKTGSNKRKRLSKAFSRPLDKKLRQEQVVRDRFTLPEVEYARLVELKKNLSDQGVAVKKSQLVRAGLLLLSELADDALKGLLEKVPSVD